jgi:hypothetical protein
MISNPFELKKDVCLALAQQIEDGFKRFNVAINQQSDIAIFISDLRWLAEYEIRKAKGFSQEERERGALASLHVLQAIDIAFAFQRLRDSSIPEDKLLIVQKRLDHLNKVDNSKAPDIFFEMEIAGRLARKEWSVIFAEPDVVIEYHGGQVGISCKRVKSIDKIGMRVSEAGKQGANSNMPYFVFIDVGEILASQHGRLLHLDTPKEFSDQCEKNLGDLIGQRSKSLGRALSKGAGGVAFYARCVGLINKPSVSLRWYSCFKQCPNLSISGAADALKELIEVMKQ